MKLTLSRRRRRRAGFSLAELMVVIVIIGLLATMVVPKLMDRFSTAQVKKAIADITTIENSLIDYRINNPGAWPSSLEVLVTPDPNGNTYLRGDNVPKDPWGNEYVYEPPPPGEKDPLIWTYGEDGVQGGEGANRDISNKMIANQEV